MACSYSGTHCYAVAEIQTSDSHGMYGSLYVHCLSSPASNFVNQEIWILRDGNPPPFWVEVGVKDGWDVNQVTHMQGWFWADSRPNGGYHEHFISSQVTLDTNHDVQIQRNGTDNWNVSGGNNFHQIGISTPNNFTATLGEAGSEYTSNSGTGVRDAGNVGNQHGLERVDSNNAFHFWGNDGFGSNGSWLTGHYDPPSSTESYAVC